MLDIGELWSSAGQLFSHCRAVRPVAAAGDCAGYCAVSAGCSAWTLATAANPDLPGGCVLYSAVGPRVPYPHCVSGQVSRPAPSPAPWPHLEAEPECGTGSEYACTATLDNIHNIVYGMTEVASNNTMLTSVTFPHFRSLSALKPPRGWG